jgi:hypothetical protein
MVREFVTLQQHLLGFFYCLYNEGLGLAAAMRDMLKIRACHARCGALPQCTRTTRLTLMTLADYARMQ